MTTTVIEANFRFESSDRAMDDFLDDVVEHLGEDLGYTGIYALATMTENTFTLGLTLPAESTGEPIIEGLSGMRTALHACGATTDGWPAGHEAHDCVRVMASNAKLVDA